MTARITREQAEAIADAYCRTRFAYTGTYATPDGRDQHIAYDVRTTADQIMGGDYRELVAVFKAGHFRGYADGYQQGRHDAQMDAANPPELPQPTGFIKLTGEER